MPSASSTYSSRRPEEELAQPVRTADVHPAAIHASNGGRAESRVCASGERAVVDRHAEVRRLRIGHDDQCVSAGAKVALDHGSHAGALWPTKLDSAVGRCTQRGISHGQGHVLRRDGLKVCGRQTDGLPRRTRMPDCAIAARNSTNCVARTMV